MALAIQNVHNWTTFVSKSMLVIPKTRSIIEEIMPYFPKGCQCITGYQDTPVQFWKVNYHWEYTLYMIDKALAKMSGSAPDPYSAQLKILRQQLMMNVPVPQQGYRTSVVEGLPKDGCSEEQIVRRWDTVTRVKRELLMMSPKLKALAPPAHAWDLATAPIAKPGSSKHGTGFALDIEGIGLNNQISEISRALGATLVFDEASHVHVEFANGVRRPKLAGT
jgi:hypothetical protein